MFKHKNLVAFLICSAVICAVYSQVVFFNRSLVPTSYFPFRNKYFGNEGRVPINSFNIDLAQPFFYELPTNRLVGDMYLKGQLPLWNSYQGCGMPLAAQYSSSAFFPYQIIEDILPAVTWDYFKLGRIIIAAFFTYLFLNLLGISFSCALFAGILYGLSGSFSWFINLEEFTNLAMMVPVCLFFLERFLRFKTKRCFVEAAIAMALVILAGQPEIAIYVLLLAAGYYLFRVISDRPQPSALLRSGLEFSGVILLCLSLSMLLVLPFLELMINSFNCHPPGGIAGVSDLSPLPVAITILIPGFSELPTYYRLFAHAGIWDYFGGYIGVSVLYLVLLGFFYKAKYRNFFLFFFLFGFFIVLKNFGFPAAAWIGRLPLLNQSWSSRWSGPVWTFCLASAAAISLENLSQTAATKKFLPKIILACILFFLILLINTAVAHLAGLENFNSALLKIILPSLLGGFVVALSVLVLLTCLFLYCRKKNGLIYSVIFLGISELWFCLPKGAAFPWTVFKFIPFFLSIIAVILLAKEKWRQAALAVILIILSYGFIDLASPYGFSQRFDVFRQPNYVKFLKEEQGFNRIVAGNNLLMPNFSSAFKLFDIRYITPMSPLIYQNYVDTHLLKEPHAWISDRLWFTGMPDNKKLSIRSFYEELKDNFPFYSYLGVKYIVAPKNINLGLPLAYDEEVRIYENPACFDRVYIAHNSRRVYDFYEAQEFIGRVGLELRNTVVLEEPAPPLLAAAMPGNNEWCRIDEYSHNKVKISVELETAGMVVLTDTYYPGWRAYVDGKESHIFRVNGLVRGVLVEKGRHSVIFKYLPDSFRSGLALSIISLFIASFFIFKNTTHARHKELYKTL